MKTSQPRKSGLASSSFLPFPAGPHCRFWAPPPGQGWEESSPVRSLSFLDPGGRDRVSSDPGLPVGRRGLQLCGQRTVGDGSQEASDVESASDFGPWVLGPQQLPEHRGGEVAHKVGLTLDAELVVLTWGRGPQ